MQSQVLFLVWWLYLFCVGLGHVQVPILFAGAIYVKLQNVCVICWLTALCCLWVIVRCVV